MVQKEKSCDRYFYSPIQSLETLDLGHLAICVLVLALAISLSTLGLISFTMNLKQVNEFKNMAF